MGTYQRLNMGLQQRVNEENFIQGDIDSLLLRVGQGQIAVNLNHNKLIFLFFRSTQTTPTLFACCNGSICASCSRKVFSLSLLRSRMSFNGSIYFSLTPPKGTLFAKFCIILATYSFRVSEIHFKWEENEPYQCQIPSH